MTIEEAKTEIMQIYMSLSEEKKQALDVLMAQADGEYISRQDAYKCLEIHGDYNTLNEVYERLEKLPSVNPQPCDDAISRDAEIKKLKEQPAQVYIDNTDYQRGYIDGVNQMVKELKVERDKAEQYPQEPPTGHWIKNVDDRRTWTRVRFICSECGKWQCYGETKFCPKCGVRIGKGSE